MDEYGYGGPSLLEDDLQGLLDAVDPAGLDYRGWVDVGMALAAEGVPWEVWDAWSARDPARYHAGECERKYRTFRAGGDGRGCAQAQERTAGQPVLHDVGHWKPLPSMSGIPCSA